MIFVWVECDFILYWDLFLLDVISRLFIIWYMQLLQELTSCDGSTNASSTKIIMQWWLFSIILYFNGNAMVFKIKSLFMLWIMTTNQFHSYHQYDQILVYRALYGLCHNCWSCLMVIETSMPLFLYTCIYSIILLSSL